MGGPGSGPKKARAHTQITGGLLGGVLQTELPTRVIGVEQRAEDRIPDACPHCHAAPPMWSRTEWEGHCRCGATVFRTVGEVRFHANRQRTPTYYDPPREEAHDG